MVQSAVPSERQIKPRRSLLQVSGLRLDQFGPAVEARPDIVCIDLEDSVPLARKDEARALVLALLAAAASNRQVELMVRINCLSTHDGLRDVLAIADADVPPSALILPKVRSGEEIRLLERWLDGRHRDIRFNVMIETNDGLARVDEIAQASARIDLLLFGAVDLSAELRSARSWDALLYARSRIIHAAARAEIDVMDVPHLMLDDLEGLEREARASQQLGFTGKAAIHPKQIAAIHKVFSPSPELIARARRIVDAFAANTSGVLVVDGEFIERPVLRELTRVLAIADRIAGESSS